MHPKPKQILDIEQIIGVSFKEIENIDKIIYADKSYVLNEKQEVIGLGVCNLKLTSIDFLKELTTLQSLSFGENDISDITVLQHLTKLTNLYFFENRVDDVTSLKHLVNLEKLEFTENRVRDISPLQDLTNLTELWFGDNCVSDISALQHLTNLTELSFHSNQVEDITVLQYLTNLRSLYFANSEIKDIGILQYLPNLTHLEFSNTQVSDITVLQHLPNLIDLDFSMNQVTDITVLRCLPNLTHLEFYNNQVTDITVLQYLPNLIDLDCTFNKIKVLPTFFTDLKKLNKFRYYGNHFPHKIPDNLQFNNLQEEIKYILGLQQNNNFSLLVQYVEYLLIFIRYALFFFGIIFLWLGYYPIDEADKDPDFTKALNYYHTNKQVLKNTFNELEKIELNFSLYKDEDKWGLMVNNKDTLKISSDSIINFFNHRNIDISSLKEVDFIRKISRDSVTICLRNLPRVILRKTYFSSQINYDKVVVKKNGMGHNHISIDDKIDISLMRRVDMYEAHKGLTIFFRQLGWLLIVSSIIIFLLEKMIPKLKITHSS